MEGSGSGIRGPGSGSGNRAQGSGSGSRAPDIRAFGPGSRIPHPEIERRDRISVDVIVGPPVKSTQFRSDGRIYTICEMISVPQNFLPSYWNRRRNCAQAIDFRSQVVVEAFGRASGTALASRRAFRQPEESHVV
jgi:hypothetical protein